MYAVVLAAAGGAVVGFAFGWALYRPMRRPRETAAQRASEETLVCACGSTFYQEQPAKEHAIETHNAHPDEWRPIMEVR